MDNLSALRTPLEFGNPAQLEALRHMDQGEECHSCCEGRIFVDLDGYPLDEDQFSGEVYDRPFDDESRILYFCDEDCLDGMTNSADFNYFWCEPCGRNICEQNPSNGYMVQDRILRGEQVCLKCYEKDILENGTDREEFEKGELPGMFFSLGNDEAREAGFEPVPDFTAYRVGDAGPVCNKAMDLIDDGLKVLVAYEAMAIGGLEGFVTLMSKK